MISDRSIAFTSEEFEDYCVKNQINHIKITTGLPNSNEQVEHLNCVIISVLTKLTIDDPGKWYKDIDQVQRLINSSYQKAINAGPFQLMNVEDTRIREILEEEMKTQF